MLKAVTTHIKTVKGRGPNNIYIKYGEKELHLVIQGTLCAMEKFALENYEYEAIEILDRFNRKNSTHMEEELTKLFGDTRKFKTYELISDFRKDLFVIKMRIE